MEQLRYEIDDKTIVELLGRQNFSTKESAVLELVKNAYDASADNLTIDFSSEGKTSLTISDDGLGMCEDDIKTKWMQIGKSDKGYYVDESKAGRVYTGEKGIGRFALSRLGSQVELLSKADNHPQVIWKSNWEKNWFDTSKADCKSGTIIHLENLSDRWTPNAIRGLSEYLSKAYNDDSMIITIRSEEESHEVSPGWPEPVFGDNCVSYIDLSYSCKDKVLTCHIFSDEFLPEASEIVSPIDTSRHFAEINMLDYLKRNYRGEDDIDQLKTELEELGDFSARFFFSLDGRSLKGEDNPYMYKYPKVPNRINQGVVLYRNAFSLSSYEGKRDWLNLSTRATSSPAAASHPTGGWRVRKNQLSGYVCIDKLRNRNLKDLSNRQGLNENTYYSLFIAILHKGINEFERYRQSIIRKIASQTSRSPVENNTLITALRNDPEIAKKFEANDIDSLLLEIDEIETSKKASEEKLLQHEERYRYDVRILNTLSTVGLKASSIAHELQNKRNLIFSSCSNIIKALREYGLWDELNKPERTKKRTKNVPWLLQENDKVSHQLLVFLDTLLDDIENDSFFPQDMNMREAVSDIVERWKADYPWVSFTVSGDEQLEWYFAQDAINVIFDNLILNSVQQNNGSDHLNMEISFCKTNDRLQFTYKDDGKGLDAAYAKDPFVILEPHESSREKGHGLGMWIVNNTIEMFNGEVIGIPAEQDGFKIIFSLEEVAR